MLAVVEAPALRIISDARHKNNFQEAPLGSAAQSTRRGHLILTGELLALSTFPSRPKQLLHNEDQYENDILIHFLRIIYYVNLKYGNSKQNVE